uniref:Gnk2-homologous domain-containing protein n=1 Tax=Aegilops tauschii subsp. strangulata TaxID=200361 RepID=A0A452ZU87_AEGTS
DPHSIPVQLRSMACVARTLSIPFLLALFLVAEVSGSMNVESYKPVCLLYYFHGAGETTNKSQALCRTCIKTLILVFEFLI